MSTLQYGNPAAEAIRAAADGDGGKVLVVAGDGRGELFDAGCYRPPAKTLLESVLTFAAAGPAYERIVVMSGTGNHLPQRLMVGSENIGLVPAVWLFRGAAEVESGPPSDVDEEDPAAFLSRGRQARDTTAGKLIAPLQGERDWGAHIRQVLAQIELACGVAYSNNDYVTADEQPRSRTLIVLDENMLVPRDDQVESLLALGDVSRVLLEKRLNEIPHLVQRSGGVDLVLLARSASTVDALSRGDMIRRQVQQRFGRNDPESQIVRSAPAVGWPEVASAEMPQPSHDLPHGPFLAGSDVRSNLYDALRGVPPRKPKNKVEPPADPTRVFLEFWATVDVPALRERLLRDIMGQRVAVNAIVEDLEVFQAICERALRAGRPLPEKHLPPSFVFTGPAGMGKTFLGKTVAQHLFGSGDFFRKIELGNRMPGETLLGTEAGYRGFGAVPEFVRFCRASRGLGAIVFDELDKIRPGPGEDMQGAMNAFLNLVEERNLTTRDPDHATRDGRLWLKNMLLMFTANLDASGNSYGYGSLSDLGSAMLQRFGRIIQFSELTSEDLQPAVSFFLKRYLRQLLDQGSFEGEVEVHSDVAPYLAQRFDQATVNAADFRSNRILELRFIPHVVPLKTMWDKFDRDDFTLGVADTNRQPWTPVV